MSNNLLLVIYSYRVTELLNLLRRILGESGY